MVPRPVVKNNGHRSPAKRPRTASPSSSDRDDEPTTDETSPAAHHHSDAAPDAGPNVETRKRILTDSIDYPRRRATIACEICRSRKSKCDGRKPKCKLCSELNADCVYREPGIKLDAGDKLILERLAHIEGLLQNGLSSAAAAINGNNTGSGSGSSNSSGSSNNNNVATAAGAAATTAGAAAPNTSTSTTQPARASFAPPTPAGRSPSSESHVATPFSKPEVPATSDRHRRASSAGVVDMIPVNGLGTWSRETANISTMPKRHTTPAFHLLQWPKIRDLISKPYDPQVLLQVEMARDGLDYTPTAPLEFTHANSYVQAYFDRVNKWYACVNPYTWASYYRIAHSRNYRQGFESCVVLLVLALGAAAIAPTIVQCPPEREPPGYNFFTHAWLLLPSLMTQNNIQSSQCYILASAYLFYIVRPLEAWTLLANSSMKLQLLLSAPGRLPAHAKELCERVYWNALLFESDLLAELDLPHSGIVQFEESVGLPGGFEKGGDEPAGKDDLWYFLVEIALRRLLNRVSHLLYTKATPEGHPSSLDTVVAELDFQLTQWYNNLPLQLKFPHATKNPSDPIQTVLRLRFFACRTIIYRPYILAVLKDESAAMDPAVQENCRKCLEACVRQLENIQAHHAGHLPYLWQGALSMVSQTLLVMGATLSPSLSQLLPPAHTIDVIIHDVIMEIVRYSHLAPSIRLSADIIQEAETRRRALLSQPRPPPTWRRDSGPTPARRPTT